MLHRASAGDEGLAWRSGKEGCVKGKWPVWYGDQLKHAPEEVLDWVGLAAWEVQNIAELHDRNAPQADVVEAILRLRSR
jgi:hypothetical protein